MNESKLKSKFRWINCYPNKESSQSAVVIPISTQLKYLSKLLSQKKILSKMLSEKIFSKLPPQKNFFKITPSKKDIFINAPSFLELLSLKIHFNCSIQRYILNIAPWKSTFSKLFPQKGHFQSCFPKKTFSYLALICSSSESSKELSKSSITHI